MTGREFLHRSTNSRTDVLGDLLNTLTQEKIDSCVIDGLAVNAYADLEKRFEIERFPNSINLSSPDSDLRVQFQTDPRYQALVGGNLWRRSFQKSLKSSSGCRRISR